MKKTTRKLMDWYRAHRILYPWRQTTDPYRIWVSEVLLQQTRIQVALPFYEKIVKRYPTFHDLAAADPAEFLASWSGIGYYRRAENMIACAKKVVAEHGGRFPEDSAALLKLPGIGKYTAGAIRNLCFAAMTPAIDGNVGRVLARLTACPLPASAREFQGRMETAFRNYGQDAPPGDFLQALMELGERLCLPRPKCNSCPLRADCAAFAKGLTGAIPAPRPRKQDQPMSWYFLMIRRKNSYYLVQNPHRGFLKTAWLFPDLLSKHPLSQAEIRHGYLRHWKIKLRGLKEVGSVRHSVTFRKIAGHILSAPHCILPTTGGHWVTREDLSSRHTSSVLHKILAVATANRDRI